MSSLLSVRTEAPQGAKAGDPRRSQQNGFAEAKHSEAASALILGHIAGVPLEETLASLGGLSFAFLASIAIGVERVRSVLRELVRSLLPSWRRHGAP